MGVFSKAKKIVIKVGSSLVVDEETGKPNQAWLDGLAEDIAELRKQKKKVAIVTSGAIALGRKSLGKNKKNLKLQEKQAAAACGQLALVGSYQKSFSQFGINTAQVLLTLEDSENRRRYLNARNTLDTLIDADVIPVINENDTVATAEIRVGDNDRLAARVAQMMGADLLVLLSDIDGLYEEDPAKNPKARHIERIDEITADIEKMAGGSRTLVGTGGMITKIMAAKIAVSSGCNTLITLGKQKNPLNKLEAGGRHTLFVSRQNPDSARKNWIAESLAARGEIIVDDGAVKALRTGKSLLPAGAIEVKGEFDRGDKIIVKSRDNKEIGRGLSAYSSKDARKIIGHKSSEIKSVLGFEGREELIHRDDLVLKQ